MIKLNINVTGIDQAIASLESVLEDTLVDYRPFFRAVVEPELKKLFREAFRSRGFGRWPPLAPSTLEEKARQGFPSAPLVRTGRYRRSAERLQNMDLERNSLTITSPVPYAKYHEYGTGRIPQREVFAAVARRLRRTLPRQFEIWQARRLR